VKWLESVGLKMEIVIASITRDRRKKLHIHRIKNHNDKWTQEENKIAKAAIRHYKNLFNLEQPAMNNNFLECIPSLITDDDNEALHKTPMEEEIKDAIFDMSADSSA